MNTLKLPELDYIIAEYLIFIDTCSLMDKNAEKFLKNKLIPKIERYNRSKSSEKPKKGIYIIKKVKDELDKYANNGSWEKRFSQKQISRKKYIAKKGLDIINYLESKDLVVIGVEDKSGHGDNDFLIFFSEYTIKHKICLITQDTDLALDVLDLRNRRSTHSKHIKAIKIIDEYGYNHFTKSDSVRKFRKVPFTIPKKLKPFKIAKTVEPETGILAITTIPKTGDFILDDFGKRMKVGEQLSPNSEGGEGIIYKVSRNNVCKIYKSGNITYSKIKKLKLMVANQITIDGVRWPKSVLYNIDKKPVGYLMREVKDSNEKTIVDLRRVFMKPLQEKYFPNWNRLNLVNTCIYNLSKIKILHKYNVIIGDVNPSNILLTPSGNTFFIDTDSYQLEGYPCPVGSPHFTAPEIQEKKDYSTFLRTIENENFAIATLLFMTLMPGKPPFSFTGGSTPMKNIKARKFPYPFTDSTDSIDYNNYKGEAPKGPWLYIWSHWPPYIQEGFICSFKEGKYLTANQWLPRIIGYKMELKQGKYNNEIYPTEYKTI